MNVGELRECWIQYALETDGYDVIRGGGELEAIGRQESYWWGVRYATKTKTAGKKILIVLSALEI